MTEFKWTLDQKVAIDKIDAFLQQELPGIFLLSGSAGTGKTTLASLIPPKIKNGLVVGTAPTHKAVHVLRMKLGGVDCMTIHSFLGLRPKKVKGEDILVRSPYYDPTENLDVTVVLLDEASMNTSQLFKYILEDIQVWRRKYILIGDKYQLPPVNEKVSPCFALDLPDEQQAELKEVVRQAADNPVISVATNIRDAIITGKEPPLQGRRNEAGVGIHVLKRQDWLAKLKNSVLDPRFKEDPDWLRVLAYRNTTVIEYNQMIREILGEDMTVPFSAGDIVTAKEPWVVNEEVKIMTGAEFTVVQLIPHVHDTFPSLKGWQVFLAEMPNEPVYVLDYLGSITAYKAALDHLLSVARASGDWIPYYTLYEYYADLRPVYSLTIHQCLPYSSTISTPNGVVELKDLKVGDKVISGRGVPRIVKAVVETGVKQLCLIKTRSGRSFWSSTDHRYLLAESPDHVFKKASSIIAGDYLCLWRETPSHKFEFDLDYYSYGYLVGNGCYSYTSNRVDVTLNGSSTVWPLLTKFLGKYGSTVHRYSKRGIKAFTLSAESKLLREELLEMGLSRVTCTQKSVCKLTTKNQQANFIRGLMDADGNCSKNTAMVRLSSSSESVVDSLLVLLQGFGIVGKKRLNRKAEGVVSNGWHLEIQGVNCALYQEQIGFSERHKATYLKEVCARPNGKSNTDFIPNKLGVQRVLRDIVKSHPGFRKKGEGVFDTTLPRVDNLLSKKYLSFPQLRAYVDNMQRVDLNPPPWVEKIIADHYYYDEVTSVEVLNNSEPMMDIEVEEDHSFISGGAVVHNSQGSTFTNVMVDFQDIYNKRHSKLSEADKCYYVAVTRATHNVVLLG